MGASVNLRRYVNPAVRDTGESEGVSPVSRALTHSDYTGTMTRYSEVFEGSRYEHDLSPYDSVMGAKDVLQDLMISTRERIRWNAAVAGSNVITDTSAHSLRTDTDAKITLGRLQVAVRALQAAKGQEFTALNNGSKNIGTNPVEPGYFCFVHTNAQPDIRAVTGFRAKSEFGGSLDAYPPGTFGAVQNIIFVTSPEALYFPDAGASVGSTGMLSTSGSKIDVYPYIIVAKHALTSVALAGNGKGGFGNTSIAVLDQADKSDPSNTRVQVSAAWYDLCMITAQEWMQRIECAVTANPA